MAIGYCAPMCTRKAKAVHKFRYVLVRCRKKQGLPQEQLSERAGISLSFLSMLEIGRRHPNIEMLFKLAAGLGVRPSSLIAALEEEVALSQACAEILLKSVEKCQTVE